MTGPPESAAYGHLSPPESSGLGRGRVSRTLDEYEMHCMLEICAAHLAHTRCMQGGLLRLARWG